MSFFNIILLSIAYASDERISAIHKDLGKETKVSIAPGLVSVLEFPQAITEVRVGHPGVLKAQISSVSPRELTLTLSGGGMVATNLIVRAERRVFVFDIVPSRVSHQDYVKIRGGFGGPTIAQSISNILIEKSISAAGRERRKRPRAIVRRALGGAK